MADSALDAPRRSRSRAGFFSDVASFSLPAGGQVTPGAVGGYYIDMRIKATEPLWPPRVGPPSEQWLHVGITQWGLGAYERYLSGEGDAWLAATLQCAEQLMASQQDGGPLDGGWPHTEGLPHTFMLRAPWLSAMAQGEGASLLVRLFAETGEERYADAARRALLPLQIDSADGGVRTSLAGRPWPEEYPTDPPSLVLNGGIFAMWGLYDVGVGLDEPATLAAFERSIDTLAANLHRWDLGYWSRYDLYPRPVPNPASSFYHDLHINQLRMIDRLTPRPVLAETAERWHGYTTSRVDRSRAFLGKALFRLMVPRNRMLAHRLPWSATKVAERRERHR